MKRIAKISMMSIMMASVFAVSAQQSRPTNPDEIVAIIRKVNDKWQAEHPDYGRAVWNIAAYHTGNMAAYAITNEERYRTYSEKWAELNEWKGAKGVDKTLWKYRHGGSQDHVLFGDWQTCFQTYIDLYNLQPDDRKIERSREVMEYQMTTPQNDYWWWVDGLYMVMPVMAKLYKITQNPLYLQKLHEYFSYTKELLYDKDENLFYRDEKYLYPKHKTQTGGKDFWSRGNGWAFAALAKTLQDVPQSDVHRQDYLRTFVSMAAALKRSQQKDGYWTRSITCAEQAAGYETSGTAFFVFGILWGINNGILTRSEYEQVALNGWKYLSTISLQADGLVGYVQPIGERAADNQEVNMRTTSDFGVGAFLLAASEMYRFVGGGK
jgi:rhamnogalacturonyl hydrolase YesR